MFGNTTTKPSKRLIVDPGTGRFLKADGGWTTEEAEAVNFNDIATLLRACSKHKVKNAEVLLRFETRKLDVRFPLAH
jgi:hypothetical protein